MCKCMDKYGAATRMVECTDKCGAERGLTMAARTDWTSLNPAVSPETTYMEHSHVRFRRRLGWTGNMGPAQLEGSRLSKNCSSCVRSFNHGGVWSLWTIQSFFPHPSCTLGQTRRQSGVVMLPPCARILQPVRPGQRGEATI